MDETTQYFKIISSVRWQTATAYADCQVMSSTSQPKSCKYMEKDSMGRQSIFFKCSSKKSKVLSNYYFFTTAYSAEWPQPEMQQLDDEAEFT